ncbi:hybrid sensor histidine kinase/response regulator [Enterovibrio norvegicus]|uniref:PAS domain S-box protein n=1 Tax=Enterovibrio norvegicus TaxID=188144 RepID=UPI000474E06E|nr:PAS domain S-box protein [Enterovibrio norvegicus]OEF65356.1 hybrid sensor histidine kinase/response regulator [Enterovibrio norvegicus]
MSIIESLTLFFLPPVTDQPLLEGYTDPWMLLLAGGASFVVAALAFLYRPLQARRQPVWQFTPLPVNALTLAFSLWLMQVLNVLSVSVYQDLGFVPALLLFPPVLTFLLCLYAFRLIAYKSNPPIKILMATGLISLAVMIQHTFGFAAINGVSIAQFDMAMFTMALGICSLLVGTALWQRFGRPKQAKWNRDMSSALLSGATITVASLTVALIMRDTLTLSGQPVRVESAPFDRRDALMMFIFGFVFIAIVSQIANALFMLKARVKHLSVKDEELDRVINTITDAIVAIDSKGHITFFNSSAERIFGWLASEAMGKNVRILVTDEHQHRHDMYIHNFIERRSSDVVGSTREVMAKRKDGTSFPIRLAIGFHQGAAENSFVAVISDISEQRHLAWALRENAKQYRSLIANLPCMAFREMTGGTRHMVYISDAAKSITGYSASVLTGENGVSHFVDRIHPTDAANYRKVRENVSRRNGKYDCEYRFSTRSDEEKWFWEIGLSYRAEDGSTWIDGVIVDITDKRQAEEDVEEKVRLAEKASQSKASFLANMSYEFRSPMNSILGLADILIDAEKDPIHRHHLEVIKESGNSLMKLINDILDTSKLESQSLPLDIGEFSLVQLCRQIEFIARETVQARELHVSLHYSDALLDSYVGDSRRIKQLLQNMMRSALTNTENGNVSLHVLPMNDMVRFAVASYAVQPSDILEKKNVHTGQTLSATLITQLIELMRGNLWFDGESIQSSVVYADLPLIAVQHAAKSIDRDAVQHYALPPLEVLVIDDVQRNQQELRDMLLRQGVKVLTFTDMDAAEDLIRTQQVDVVLMDAYVSEEMYPSPRTLRDWVGDSRQEPVRVIAMKLAVDPTTTEEWQGRGFDDVINKPFECEAVFDVLKRCMGIDENSNVTVLTQPITQEEKVYFNESWAFQQWPTSDILLSIVREFRLNYLDMPVVVKRMVQEQPDSIDGYFNTAIDAAECLGFEKLAYELKKLLSALQEGEVSELGKQLDSLNDCLSASFDNVLAYLGVRREEMDDAEVITMPPATFNKKTEEFVSKLAEGQFDDVLYKELVPAMASYVEPPLLATFVAAIENFELDDAYDIFLTVLDQVPAAQESGVKGYGI